jgi:biotin carboxyl carrier protein
MYKATVNSKTFDIDSTTEGMLVNGDPLSWDIVKIAEGYFHILYQQKSYRAEIVSTDSGSKTVTVKINGRKYPVQLKDKFDLLLEKMGIADATAGKINHIKAPMPGLILDLKVNVGDAVKIGDQVLILEAMKMENVLKSSGEGTVKTLNVKKGDRVEKGQVLIEF